MFSLILRVPSESQDEHGHRAWGGWEVGGQEYGEGRDNHFSDQAC